MPRSGASACHPPTHPHHFSFFILFGPAQGRVLELKQERLFNIAYLQQQHGVTPHHVDVLHR